MDYTIKEKEKVLRIITFVLQEFEVSETLQNIFLSYVKNQVSDKQFKNVYYYLKEVVKSD